jgi:hypothetical protein
MPKQRQKPLLGAFPPPINQKRGKSMNISHLRLGLLITTVVVAIGSLISIQKLIENVSASDYVVIQSPVAGTLSWYTTPGVAWQGFGDVTTYPIRMRYDFRERGYLVQFNDGGHGTIHGSIQCDLPPDHKLLTDMFRKFPNQEQVENSLIKTATEGALYLVGPLMSSRESYAEKKNDLIGYVTDMVEHGPYKTRQVHKWTKDPITNQDKEIVAAEIVQGKDGTPERQEASALGQYGIKCYQFTINKIDYDEVVAAQIKQQQQITMNVQTSIADKVLAEQKAQTAEANGRASATEAKWKQETIKATEVTKADQERAVQLIIADRDKQVQLTNANRDKEVAETLASQRLAVAELDKKSAEQKKQELTLLGEGQAAQKKAVIMADGALEQKLAAYIQVQAKYADAMRGAHMVPSVVMGGSAAGGPQAFNAQDFMSLLGVKAAKDLALDMSMPASPTYNPKQAMGN